MLVRRIGYVLVVIGLLGVAISLGADLVGIGSKGIQATQILGAQAGVVLALIGAALIVAAKNGGPKIQSALGRIGQFFGENPVAWLALAGFFVAFIWFFIAPTFFDERLQFEYYNRYLPSNANLGVDLRTITKYTKDWIVSGKNPYRDDVIYYPPLYNILFAPVILIGYPQSFYFFTVTSIVCYVFLALLLPMLFPLGKNSAVLLLVFVTGIFSYGLQFELERGQFNLIAFALCLLAVFLFHYHEKYRFFAYLFFSLSVQLKIYPLIFIVMFIKDWRDWKNNLLRMAGLGLVNFALLFSMGYTTFFDFLRGVGQQVLHQSPWMGNHSIKSFVYNLGLNGFGVLQENVLAWTRQNPALLEFLLMGIFAVCFLSIIVAAYLRRETGLNPTLLLVCAIGALIIPSVSHDYKLSLLAGPVSIAFSCLTVSRKPWRQILISMLIFVASFAYSVTLFPFKYRPDFLANSFPALLGVLVAFTLLYHLSSPLNVETVVPEE
jgi:hypothetical protein